MTVEGIGRRAANELQWCLLGPRFRGDDRLREELPRCVALPRLGAFLHDAPLHGCDAGIVAWLSSVGITFFQATA